ncbi:MAG: prepilin-type N-terminal cleavage/methylation domain-containing protein [Fusobacterium sp.]|nr:prepilin-type N-terminal cleavage/methylation domain-containing protein [Fusobacterium sp.]
MKRNNVLTCAGGGGTAEQAFTMAEILLSLTIIGVVAAITLPSLTGNINERTWNTQRKALYARFSQAISLMPSLNGYGLLTTNSSGSVTQDTAAETFVTSGLGKVLKINNVCDSEHLSDCGVPQKVTALRGTIAFNSFPQTLVDYNSMFSGAYSLADGTTGTYHQTNTKAAAFETANGESIVVYYNPYCKADNNETSYYKTQPKMCANFIYDLNGSKGPNTVGKDIGVITALYSSDSMVVAPMPIVQGLKSAKHSAASALCREIDSESRMPTREEAASLFFNRILFATDAFEGSIWTGSRISSDTERAWLIELYGGTMWDQPLSETKGVQCVKR